VRPSARSILVDVVIAVLFAGVAGGAAWLLSLETPPSHEATVRFSVVSDPLVAGDDPGAYSRAVRSDVVVRDALERMGAVQPEAGQVGSLRDLVAVDARGDWPGGATLHVGVSGPTPEVAEGRADAVAAALAAWDEATTPERLREAMDALESRIASLTTRIRTEQVLGPGGDEVEALVAQRTQAMVRRDRAEALLASGEPIETLERIGTETTRIAPRPVRNAGVTAAIAALVSLLLGVRRPRRRPRSRTGGAAAAIGAGILATFPRGQSEDDPALRGAAGRLRSAVLSRMDQARPRVILATSTAERSGVTVVACRLAEELARQGRRTLLVDGDLWSPDIAARYGIEERPVDGKPAATTVEWLQRPAAEHRVVTVELGEGAVLHVVPQFRPTRPAPGAGEALFAGLATALERWAEYDVVVVDSAPLTVVEDTDLLARHATGVMLVVPREPLDDRRLKAARGALRDAGTSLLGFVENDVPPKPEPEPVPEEDLDVFPRVIGPRERPPARRRERSGVDRGDGDGGGAM